MRIILIILLFLSNTFGWNFIIPKISRPNIKINIWDHKQFPNKKYISITPGGIGGFYSLGISSFLINNYNLTNYSFIGASAGAWTSLVCCYKKDHNILIKNLLNQDLFDNSKGSVSKLQYDLFDYFINHYNTSDFDMNRLNICISELKKNPTIISKFDSLEKAINCCIVSSHIPYITSDTLIKKYDNKVVFDGGFSEFPPKSVYNHFVISPNKFNNKIVGNMLVNILNKNISKQVVNYFYNQGYEDASKNKLILNKIFDPKFEYINVEDNDFNIISN